MKQKNICFRILKQSQECQHEPDLTRPDQTQAQSSKSLINSVSPFILFESCWALFGTVVPCYGATSISDGFFSHFNQEWIQFGWKWSCMYCNIIHGGFCTLFRFMFMAFHHGSNFTVIPAFIHQYTSLYSSSTSMLNQKMMSSKMIVFSFFGVTLEASFTALIPQYPS